MPTVAVKASFNGPTAIRSTLTGSGANAATFTHFSGAAVAFKTISVSGQSDVVADVAADTLPLPGRQCFPRGRRNACGVGDQGMATGALELNKEQRECATWRVARVTANRPTA